MKIYNANITEETYRCISNILNKVNSYEQANEEIFKFFGIYNFFDCSHDFQFFHNNQFSSKTDRSEIEVIEYGDYQTNNELAESAVKLFKDKYKLNPKLIIEPTCGQGSFIMASLKHFTKTEKIIGIDIYKPYLWETKFNIINYYLLNKVENKPQIELYHSNIFEFNLENLVSGFTQELLIIGNPPWVTNSKLSSINSNNLPKKQNFNNLKGIESITGKGNFDIGESVLKIILEKFNLMNSNLLFILKNSIIKNTINKQLQNKYQVSNMSMYSIDSKSEFNVSVEASVFFCKLGKIDEYFCRYYEFDKPNLEMHKFGWINNKFVSNFELYNNFLDGKSQLEWRQGIKHDVSAILELEKIEQHYINSNNEIIELEENLVYRLLKSSDLKDEIINSSRKYTIITQRKIGQETSYIENLYPLTYNYLFSNSSLFEGRKSIIYRNKPDFSLFGIGDYSFLPYKVAISGFYKNYRFCLVLPSENKPIMLDDTCYFLSFNSLTFAAFTTILLNSTTARNFLNSIIFTDSKRVITKDILMRLDIFKLANLFTKEMIRLEVLNFEQNNEININIDEWEDYLEYLNESSYNQQTYLFEDDEFLLLK